LASVIVDRTHTACGSRMEAATTAISSLGFALDRMVQRVLTRMRRGARRGEVVQACGWPELGFGWKHAHGSKAVAGSWEGCGVGSESDRRKKKGEWGQPRLEPPYLWGGPLNLPVAVPSAVQHASMDLFQEIREKFFCGFVADWLKPRPKLRVRSSAGHKLSSGRPDGKQVNKPPRHINLGL
jgi:hypothetical protein